MIDLRSDTVTRPSQAMRDAMAAAEVGDDVWGDDPTVIALQQEAAELLGKEAGLYVPSGTQSNLCALMAHCQRGDEYIVGDNAHTFRYEAGGAAVLGSIQPQTVRTLPSGMLDLAHVASVIKPDDHHFARSRLLCLENTHDGKAIPLADMEAAAALAAERGLRMHLDGARLWNAAVALDLTPAQVAAPFETVSVCLSKGLGAPVGSVLVGPADRIDEAHKWRKMLGGAMRQAGIIAEAGRWVLRHNIDRLADDHANAAALAAGLAEIDGMSVGGHATNMVFAAIEGDRAAEIGPALQDKLAADDILLAFGGAGSRMVTHLDVSADDITTVIDAVGQHLAALR